MSQSTSIEWTDATWNPTRGCSRVSEGCRNCYAERDAARKNSNPKLPGYKGFAQFVQIGDKPEPRWTGKVELIESKLLEPLHWRKPRRVFVNSMSDLFHENLPDADILSVFRIMGQCPVITFQILTKRSENMRRVLSGRRWRNLGYSPAMGGDHYVPIIPGEHRADDAEFLPNVHLGVSVEDQPTADQRIPELLKTPAAVRFVSYEPALVGVNFHPWIFCQTCFEGRSRHPFECKADKLDQVIIGGESGPGARPFDLEWARDTIRQCKAAGVAVFVKQLGSRPYPGSLGTVPHDAQMPLKDRKGADMSEWLEDLRVREFPAR